MKQKNHKDYKCLNSLLDNKLEDEVKFVNSNKAFSEYVKNIGPQMSSYFSNAYYLKYESVKSLMDYLEYFFNNSNQNLTQKSHLFNLTTEYYMNISLNHTILIETIDDFNYAKNMLQLYCTSIY